MRRRRPSLGQRLAVTSAALVATVVALSCAGPVEPRPNNQCPVGGQVTSREEARSAKSVSGGNPSLKEGAEGVYTEITVNESVLYCRFPSCPPDTSPDIYANRYRCVQTCKGNQVHNQSGDCVCDRGTQWQDGACRCVSPRFFDQTNNCVVPPCPQNEVFDGKACVCYPPRRRDQSTNACELPPCPQYEVHANGTGECVCISPRQRVPSGACMCPRGTHSGNQGVCEPDPCPPNEYRNSRGDCACSSIRVRDEEANCVCPLGAHEVSGSCEWDPCPSPMLRSGAECIPPTCRGGKRWDSVAGACACPAAKVESAGGVCRCPRNFTEVADTCTCEAPRVERSGTCSCPTGRVARGDSCDCPTGQEENADGRCVVRRDHSVGAHCCDGFGNRRCAINPSSIGSVCFCFGLGYGVTCP